MSLVPLATTSLVEAVADFMQREGFDLPSLARAWARVTPTIVLVPAFGLRALPAPSRALLSLAFAASIFPAVAKTSLLAGDGPWALALIAEIVRGLPLAVATAVPLWAATMAGGVVDALRGAQDTAPMAVVEGRASPSGVLLSLLASAIFLGTGGPARVAGALAFPPSSDSLVLSVVQDVTGGIALAVALAGPLLAASVVVEVAAALISRAASPAQVHSLLAPARAIALLAVLGVVAERIASVLAASLARVP